MEGNASVSMHALSIKRWLAAKNSNKVAIYSVVLSNYPVDKEP